jgi:hypothetical protein
MRKIALIAFVVLVVASVPAFAQLAIGQGAIAAPAPSGGIIRLAAFGWLEPYVDTLVQLLIAAGFSWFAKTKYGQMMDKESRDALETFLKNRASSLIADGAVAMEGKTVVVSNTALAAEVNQASKVIPGALKRFGLTPQVVGARIVDAIPQIAAGAAIVSQAHAKSPPPSEAPPTAAAQS